MFYDVFLRLCASKNVSPSKAAEAIGLNRAAVAKWKNGATPSAVTAIKLANYFGVTTDYLLGKPDQKENPPALTKKDERKKKNVVRTIGRDGSYEERYLTDEQLEALKAVMRQMPKVEDDF